MHPLFRKIDYIPIASAPRTFARSTLYTWNTAEKTRRVGGGIRRERREREREREREKRE